MDFSRFQGTELGTLETSFVANTLSNDPFVQIEGVINSRNLPLPIVSRAIIRSGEISRITPKGKDQLKALGVTKIFDFRSNAEMRKYKTPIPEIENVEIVNIPALAIERNEDPKEALVKFAGEDQGASGFLNLYTDVLEQGGPAFRAIFQHLRDNPDEGCMFHCTAGKDRTGIAAMLILSLAGVDDATIAKDYALSRIGLEPARDTILMRFKQVLDASDDLTSIINAFGSRYDTMLATLELLRNKYGGVVPYLKAYCELTDIDLNIVKASLMS